MFFQQLVNGLSIGSIYALMAVGYSLIYSLLNFTNFAHSITVTIGAFCAFFFLSNLVQNLYLGIAIAVLVAGGLAMLIELLGYRPLLQKKARRIYLLITGLGISTMCENLIIFVVSMIALIAVELFIRKSRAGLAIRGASFDLEATSLMGVNVQKLILIVFMIAGSLAGLAGALLGAKYTAFPTLGTAMTNKAFISSVFGGLGSIPGAVLGAILLGVGETMIASYVSSSMRDIFAYLLLVIVLFVRPSGLMGKEAEDKA